MSSQSLDYQPAKTRGRQPTDAPAGDCQRRTAAGPPAAPKLVRKTFLVDHTESNSTSSAAPGSVWSVKIHDFGKQWIESSWGKVDPHPGKRGLKGQSANTEQNEKRAQARAKGEIRRKCLSIGADHLVTLTYRDNVEERERVLTDLERLRRMLSRSGYSMPYVAVLECQKRGAIHPHLAVRGFQDIRLLRRCWYKIVGKAQGQVNVKGPRPGTSPVKLARYLSKYISKDIDSQPREFEEHRYFCSLGIACQQSAFRLSLPATREKRNRNSSSLCSTTRYVVLESTARSSTGLEGQEPSDGYQASKTRLVTGAETHQALRKLRGRGPIPSGKRWAAIAPGRLCWRDCLPGISHSAGFLIHSHRPNYSLPDLLSR